MKKLITFAAIAATASAGSLAAQDKPDHIVVANTGGPYLQAVLDATGKAFEEKTGIEVLGDGPQTLPQLQQMVQADRVTWDVVEVPPVFTMRYCGELFQELPEDLQNYENVLPGFGNKCGINSVGYANIMLYNTSAFPDGGPQNWADFFDTEKFPGKRGLWDGAEGVNLEIALMADGVAPQDLYPLDLDRAFAKLDTIRDDIVFWRSGAQSTQMMESEEVDMLMAWSSRAYPALKNGAPFEPVWNQHIIYNNVLTIPKGVAHPDVSADFIRTAMEAAQQARVSELYPVTPGVIGTEPDLDEAGQKVFAATPERAASAVVPDLQWVADNSEEINRRWTEWLNN
ncbi:ABC transporter substrate-binding protein [Oceanibium sediminis]|uniref:ABC transporter substrate-binding protein n=1 Tax=Oceanibium sediminis TaxID=2026339 RepID=UPI000DD41F0A|nr:ABC transporter substrate-binding protein [Oceanibium sediminis]